MKLGAKLSVVEERQVRPGEFVVNVEPIELAVEIVVAFVSNNSVPIGELSNLLESVHAAFNGSASLDDRSEVNQLKPAVSIRKSVTPDHLICLDDGKRFKSLRRHLAMLDMTPEQYRAKWGLPPTYPMVAPNYAALRSEISKTNGRGQARKKLAAAPPELETKRKPGRPRKQ